MLKLIVPLLWVSSVCMQSGCGGGGGTSVGPAATTVTVQIVNAAGRHFNIDAETATNTDQWAQGLMNRPSLGTNSGMLFVFPGEDFRSFWMKNTMISLDMLFINSAGIIVDINQNAVPYSLTAYTSGLPARYVLEVNGGYCAAHDISVNDRVVVLAGL
jgi:uncharacterized protein